MADRIDDNQENILRQAVQQFIDARLQGREPDINEFVKQYPQLEHQTAELTTPAVSGCLYVHNPGHDEALELIPLVQVRDLPQPASYFYNRLEKTEMCLVAYHFVHQSEVVDEGDAVEQLLFDLSPEETA